MDDLVSRSDPRSVDTYLTSIELSLRLPKPESHAPFDEKTAYARPGRFDTRYNETFDLTKFILKDGEGEMKAAIPGLSLGDICASLIARERRAPQQKRAEDFPKRLNSHKKKFSKSLFSSVVSSRKHKGHRADMGEVPGGPSDCGGGRPTSRAACSSSLKAALASQRKITQATSLDVRPNDALITPGPGHYDAKMIEKERGAPKFTPTYESVSQVPYPKADTTLWAKQDLVLNEPNADIFYKTKKNKTLVNYDKLPDTRFTATYYGGTPTFLTTPGPGRYTPVVHKKIPNVELAGISRKLNEDRADAHSGGSFRESFEGENKAVGPAYKFSSTPRFSHQEQCKLV